MIRNSETELFRILQIKTVPHIQENVCTRSSVCRSVYGRHLSVRSLSASSSVRLSDILTTSSPEPMTICHIPSNYIISFFSLFDLCLSHSHLGANVSSRCSPSFTDFSATAQRSLFPHEHGHGCPLDTGSQISRPRAVSLFLYHQLFKILVLEENIL